MEKRELLVMREGEGGRRGASARGITSPWRPCREMSGTGPARALELDEPQVAERGVRFTPPAST